MAGGFRLFAHYHPGLRIERWDRLEAAQEFRFGVAEDAWQHADAEPGSKRMDDVGQRTAADLDPVSAYNLPKPDRALYLP